MFFDDPKTSKSNYRRKGGTLFTHPIKPLIFMEIMRTTLKRVFRRFRFLAPQRVAARSPRSTKTKNPKFQLFPFWNLFDFQNEKDV